MDIDNLSGQGYDSDQDFDDEEKVKSSTMIEEDIFDDFDGNDENLSSYIVRDLDSGMAFDMRADGGCLINLHSQLSTVITPSSTISSIMTTTHNNSTSSALHQTFNNTSSINNIPIKAWTAFWRETKRKQEQFFDYVQTGQVEEVQKFIALQDISFTVNIRWHDDWTALHYAASEGDVEMVNALINLNADCTAYTSFRYTALHLSCLRGSLECVSAILNHDYSTVNNQDNEFNTAVHYACRFGYELLVDCLLLANADLSLKNHFGNTPAEETTNINILRRLFKESKTQQASDQQQQQQPQQQHQQQQQQQQQQQNLYGRTILNDRILKNSRQDHVSRLLQMTKLNMTPKNENNVPTIAPQVDQQKPVAVNTGQFARMKMLSRELFTKKNLLSPLPPPLPSWPQEIQLQVGPKDFIVKEMLGKGSFGQVYLVTKKSNGQDYAMKVLKKELVVGKKVLKYSITERNVLSLMQHPFVVSLKYAFQTINKLYLIIDYCPGGDLDALLCKKGRLPESVAKMYICEILLAMEALHEKNILFRDLKPANVVLDAEGHAKITDFGLAKQGMERGDISQSFCGSLAYLPPEMLNKTGHSQSLDWYLLGVLFFELLDGIPPYYSDTKQKLFDNIRNASLKMPKNASEKAKSLIKALLNKDPVKRLGSKGSEEVKAHPFFDDVDWKAVFARQLKPPVQKKLVSVLMGGIQDPLRVTISELPQNEIDSDTQKDSYNYVKLWDFSIDHESSCGKQKH